MSCWAPGAPYVAPPNTTPQMYIYGHRWGKGSPAEVRSIGMSFEKKISSEGHPSCAWKACELPAHAGRPFETELGQRFFCPRHIKAFQSLPPRSSKPESKPAKVQCQWKGCEQLARQFVKDDPYRKSDFCALGGRRVFVCNDHLGSIDRWSRSQKPEGRAAADLMIIFTGRHNLGWPQEENESPAARPEAEAKPAPAAKESPASCSWTSFSTQTIDGVEKRIPAPCPSIASVTIESKHGPLSVCKEHSPLVPAQTQEVA